MQYIFVTTHVFQHSPSHLFFRSFKIVLAIFHFDFSSIFYLYYMYLYFIRRKYLFSANLFPSLVLCVSYLSHLLCYLVMLFTSFSSSSSSAPLLFLQRNIKLVSVYWIYCMAENSVKLWKYTLQSSNSTLITYLRCSNIWTALNDDDGSETVVIYLWVSTADTLKRVVTDILKILILSKTYFVWLHLTHITFWPWWNTHIVHWIVR